MTISKEQFEDERWNKLLLDIDSDDELDEDALVEQEYKQQTADYYYSTRL